MNKQLLNKISVVICTMGYDKRQANVQNLIKDIKDQSIKLDEIIIVNNYSPRTRAHNTGVQKASGDIIIFFDDDVRLGDKNIIYNMVLPLTQDASVGASGATVLIPSESSPFQKKCAEHLLRVQKNIYKENKESDLTTHAAMAINKKLYNDIGGENEKLKMNDDLFLRFKIREKGLKTIIAKDAWVYHPMPKNLKIIIKKYFIQGKEQAHDYKQQPDNIYESPLDESQAPKKSSVINQIKRNIIILFKALIKFRYILIITRLSTGLGFFYGFLIKDKNKKKKLNESVEIIKYETPANK